MKVKLLLQKISSSAAVVGGKIACVHSMPRALMLAKLLAENLAEYILLKISLMVTLADTADDIWSTEQHESMRTSVM